MKKSRVFHNGQIAGHGDVIGGFNSSSLDYVITRAREAFLSSLQTLQSGTDPKPYLLTMYALTLIGDATIRDKIIADFEASMSELPDRFSPDGIIVCLGGWAAISEYCGILGADKKLTVVGDSSDLPDDLVYEQPNPLEKVHQLRNSTAEEEDISIMDFDENDENEDE